MKATAGAERWPRRTLEVLSVGGQEAVSRPFQFELDLVSKTPDRDTKAILQQPAFIGIKQGIPISGGKRGMRTRKIHGMLRSFERRDRSTDWVTFRAAVVPRLWRFSLTIQSRIFLEKKIPKILAAAPVDPGGDPQSKG